MPRYFVAFFSQNDFRNVLIITGSIVENGKISGKLLTQLYFKVEDFCDHLSMYVIKSNVLFHYQALRALSFFPYRITSRANNFRSISRENEFEGVSSCTGKNDECQIDITVGRTQYITVQSKKKNKKKTTA